jgi:NADH dehydrogenase
MCYELGGPRVYTYRSLLEVIARSLDKKPLLVPVPFGLWRMLALIAEIFPQPAITRNQVELMQMNNEVSLDAPGFADLQISPRSLEDVLPTMMEPPDGVSRVPPVA